MSFLRFRIVIFIFVVAAFLGYLAWQESTLAFSSTAEPETMTLKQLIERGPGGNPNIRLTDFFAIEDYSIYDGGTADGGWKEVWVPLLTGDVVRSGDKPDSWAVKVILSSKRIHNPDELNAVCEQSALSVVVMNQVSSLPDDIQWMIESRYQGIDMSKCLILETGRQPGNLTWLLLTAIGSVLGFVVGLIVLFPEAVFRMFGHTESTPEPSQT